jgi:hypothetical protein
LVEFAERVGYWASIESNRHLAEFEMDGFDVADIAIIDLFVIVVLDLHDLVADGKGRPEFLDLWFFARIESPLQLDIQRTGAKSAAIHRAENLDVAHRIEAELAGMRSLDKFDEPRDGHIRLGSRDEIKVRRILRSG